jgi:hypothetical protein
VDPSVRWGHVLVAREIGSMTVACTSIIERFSASDDGLSTHCRRIVAELLTSCRRAFIKLYKLCREALAHHSWRVNQAGSPDEII